MNRRTFLASLIALPAAAKAAIGERRGFFMQFDSTQFWNARQTRPLPGMARINDEGTWQTFDGSNWIDNRRAET